jgi:hypothetical protein
MLKQGVRRSARIATETPILLIGSDSEGRIFCEETKTVILSLHGAGIVSKYKLFAEQELVLRWLETNQEVEIRVVGEIGSQGQSHTYGVAFLDERLDFWKMEFPPAAVHENEFAQLTLECSCCHTPITLENADLEFDVCILHGGVVRYCGNCNLPTVWKRSTEIFNAPSLVRPAGETRQTPDRAVAVLDPQPRNEREPVFSPVALGANRRERVRAKVNYFACVRSPGFGDDVVVCLDMSRGGLSFKSQHCYAKSTLVQIAVPFSPESRGAPTIFVPAQIANVEEMQGLGLHRCGVAFLPGNATYTHG